MLDRIRGCIVDEGHTFEGDRFKVQLAGGRKQTITIGARNGVIRMSTVVVTPAAARRTLEGPLQLLRLNRFTELVEFTIDGRGRWIAQSVLPVGDVEGAEVMAHVRALAAAADRLEQIISGADRY